MERHLPRFFSKSQFPRLLALDIYETIFGGNSSTYSEGRGQAKAVIFFLIVALITFVQLRLTRSKEVES